jgi:hypothetical protein
MPVLDDPYTTAFNHEAKDYCIRGPGKQLSHNCHSLYPYNSFKLEPEGINAAKIANIAFNEGYLLAQLEMRLALGFTK